MQLLECVIVIPEDWLPVFLMTIIMMCVQVGEDVPDARKCACASHVATIAEFFQVGLAKVK